MLRLTRGNDVRVLRPWHGPGALLRGATVGTVIAVVAMAWRAVWPASGNSSRETGGDGAHRSMQAAVTPPGLASARASRAAASSLGRPAPLPSSSGFDSPDRLPSVPVALPSAKQNGTDESLVAQASSFAETDPESGLVWAGQLESTEARQQALEALAWGCAATHLPVAVRALDQLPSGEARQRLAGHLASQWAAVDPDQAEHWARQRLEPDERDAALAAVAIGCAESHPVRAATLVASDLPDGATRDHAVLAVVQRWVQTDPAAAERWVVSFADHPLQGSAQAALHGTPRPVPPADSTGP